MRLSALLPLLALFPSNIADAAWVRAPGTYYLKVWDRTLVGTRVLDLDGNIEPLGLSFQDHAMHVYAEYGATKDITLVAHAAPLGFSKIGEEATVYSGLNQVGIRFALVQGTVPLALELSYGYSPPLGKKPLTEGTVAGQQFIYRPTFEQHLGRGELQAGYAFDSFWLKATTGATFSSGEDIDPAIEGSFYVGARTPFDLDVAVGALVHFPVRKPRFIDVTGVGNTRYVGIELSVAWWLFPNVALSVGVGGAPYATSNAAVPALSFGVEIRS